jgi:riboflavin kinase/FMN adenylyltransferase
LERPYRFSGRVVRGRGLGRELGWPTANLQVDGRKFLPLEGVYAAAASVAGGPLLPAVMNLGPQPTVDPMAPSAVEVHLLDRRLELDGMELVVEPLQLLRRQQTFANFDALCTQIAADADRARSLWSGVSVGETPADEGGDPAEQQNP